MKKVIAYIISVLLTVGMLGCAVEPIETTAPSESAIPTETSYVPQTTEEAVEGYVVSSPMQYPDYTFDTDPSTDELRQMAVQAMRDMLSVQWSVDRTFTYKKSARDKIYVYDPDTTYAGLPYSDAAGSIVQWFEYYDTQTGRLNIPGDTQQMNDLVGNTCAGSVCAAWYTVCDSIRAVSSSNMVPLNGFIPVGTYVSKNNISSYEAYPTNKICRENGEAVMLASYAAILPADALVSVGPDTDQHVIMAIEPAHVVYRADGSIDSEASYIVLQDQRSGHNSTSDMYFADVDGELLHFSGRTYAEYSFKKLWDLGYIPVTAAEFFGQKPYTATNVSVDKEVKTLQDLKRCSILSNYPICVAKMILKDETGKEIEVKRVVLDKFAITDGRALKLRLSYNFNTSIDDGPLGELMEPGKTYTLCFRVTVSNAQEYTPIEIAIVK